MAKKLNRPNGIVIAIDGPAGAGKSTVAKEIAKKLAYTYVDTGAIYRCVALLARQKGVLPENFSQSSPDDQQLKKGEMDASLKEILKELAPEGGIRFAWHEGQHQVYMLGRNVSQEIRREANSQAASSISSRPLVRSGLLDFQRRLGENGAAVLEGRDIGTVVFPDAELKVFLEASAEERAQRRFKDLTLRGEAIPLKEIQAAINERDRQDKQRDVAPLKAADDAETLDTTQLSIDEVIEHILSRAKAKI